MRIKNKFRMRKMNFLKKAKVKIMNLSLKKAMKIKTRKNLMKMKKNLMKMSQKMINLV